MLYGVLQKGRSQPVRGGRTRQGVHRGDDAACVGATHSLLFMEALQWLALARTMAQSKSALPTNVYGLSAQRPPAPGACGWKTRARAYTTRR